MPPPKPSIRAWEREIELLRNALAETGAKALGWNILIEVPLLRLGKRLDVVLLAPGVVALIEFKIGATRHDPPTKLRQRATPIRFGTSMRRHKDDWLSRSSAPRMRPTVRPG